MYFKTVFKLVVLLLSTAQFLACAKEEAPYHEIPVIQLKKASCLADSVGKIDNYFAGAGTRAEIDSIWSCYSYALKTFERYVQGQNAESYTSEELRTFLETYFLKGEVRKKRRAHIISNPLLDEMMAIKRLFLGGSVRVLTKHELLQTLKLIKVFRKITDDLLPHTKLLFITDADFHPSEAEFQVAEKALMEATSDLTGLLNFDTSRYEMSNLTRLLNELNLFFRDVDPDSSFGKVHKFIPVIAKSKALLLNANSYAIEASEWPALGRLLAQVAAMGIRASYSIDTDSLYKIDKLDQVEKAIALGLNVFRDSLIRRNNAPITISELGEVVDELAKLDVLPFSIAASDFKKLVLWFFDFALNPQGVNAVSGLTNEKINFIQDEVVNWTYVQRLLLLKQEDLSNAAWLQMRAVLKTPFSLSLDSLNRVVLDGDKNSTNLVGATRLNWARAGLNLLFKAYIKDDKRRGIKLELSTEELHTAFLDLRAVFVGMGLINKDDLAYDVSLFRDANLFMPRSDGNDFLGFHEIVEYLHFVFSGIDAGTILVNQASEACHVSEDALDVNCFRHNFRVQSPEYLQHLPFYLKYSRHLSESQWGKDIRNMERTNREGGNSPEPILNADIYETFVMLQYIEVIMLRFDEDQSGDLDLKEVLKTLKHFKNVIGKLLGPDIANDPEEMEAVFTYMLKYGETPFSTNPLARIRYKNWKWQKQKWHLAADRGTFLQILATLKSL